MPTVTVHVGSRSLTAFELQALTMYGRGHQITAIAAHLSVRTEDLHPVMLLCAYGRQQARAFVTARRFPGVQQEIEPTRAQPKPAAVTLPRGERDVLALFAAGKSAGQIAIGRGVSPSSVSKMLSRMLIRLGVDNRADAIRTAIRLGLIEEPPPATEAVDQVEVLPMPGSGRRAQLSPADRQILRLYAAGQSTQQIALAMGVHKQTTHDRVARICAYLRIEFTRDAATAAVAALRDDPGPNSTPLTPTMLETLALIHVDADVRRLATVMEVTERTARSRLGTLCSRMGVLTPADALKAAIDGGLFSPAPEIVAPVVEVVPVPIVKRRRRETDQQWWDRLTPVQRTAYLALAAGSG